MTRFDCHGTRVTTTEIRETIDAIGPRSAAAAFHMRHGFAPDSVGNYAVLGLCGSCVTPIVEGDECVLDDDGNRYCETCTAGAQAAGDVEKTP